MELQVIRSRSSFRRQIILTFVVGFFLLIGGFTLYLVLTERDNLHRDSMNATTSMAQALAASARPWVLADDVAGLQEAVHAFHAYPEFSYAMVLSPSGRVLAHSDPSLVGKYLADKKSQEMLGTQHVIHVLEDSHDTFAAAVPIEMGKQQVGWAWVSSLNKQNADYLQEMIWHNLIFLLISTALSFLAAMAIANRLGRHIRTMVRVAESVQGGNYSTRISVAEGEDEIARLGNSLNRMLETLAKNEHDLRNVSHYTRSLIESSLDPLVTISPEGKITDVNAATEKATGMNRAELIGTDFSDYFTEPDKARAGYQGVFEKGFVTDYPLALRHRDGYLTDVLYNASLYRDEAGKVLGVFAAARDVSERKRAELIARLREEALEEAQRIAHVGSWYMDLASNEVYWSEELYHMYGYDPALPPPLYTESMKLFKRDSWDRLSAAIARAVETGIPYELELEMVPVTGGMKWMQARGELVRDEHGKPVRVRGVAMDITERKQMELQLRQSSAYTRSLIEASLDPLVTISPEGKITDVNAATEKATGMNRAKLIGTDFSEYFTEPDKARAGYKEVFEKGFVTDYPLVLRHKDGHLTDVLYNASQYRDEGGKVLGVFAAARDVTERNKAEAAVRESEALLQTTMKILPVGLWVLDASGQVIFANDAAKEIWRGARYVGIEKFGEYKGWRTDTGKAVAPHDWAGARALEKGESTTDEEVEIECFDGSHKFILDSAVPLRNADESIRGAVTINQDITERKHLELRLMQASSYTRSLIEASLDPLVTISTEGKITDVNAATEKATGMNRAELIGTDFSDYFTEPDKARAGYKEVFEKGFVTDYPLVLRHKDGHLTDVLYNASQYRDEGGKVLGVFAAARDVTERKRAEDALFEAQEVFRSMVENSPDIITRYDRELRRTYVNPTYLKTAGIPKNDLLGSSPAQLSPLPRESAAQLQQLLRNVLDTGTVSSIDVVWPREDNIDHWYNIFAFPEFDRTGRVVSVMTMSREITERKLAENELREKEERLSLATAINGVGIWDWNLKTQQMIWDDSMYTLYHLRREDFIGTEEAWRKSLHPDDLARGDREVEEAIAGIKPFDTEFRVVWPNGEIHYIKAVAKIFRDEQGNPARMLGTNLDITERKKAEFQLLEEERHALSLLRLSKSLEIAQTYTDAIIAARNEVREVIGYQNLWIYLFSDDKKYAKSLAAEGNASDTILSDEGTATLKIEGDRMMEEIAEAKDIVIVADARTDERTNKEIVERMEIRTLINVPVFFMDKHIGCVGTGTFGDEGVRPPSPSETEYLRALASHIAVTLDRIHLLGERKKAETEVRTLNAELEQRVQSRTSELQAANHELEAFSYSVSHDLRSPLRAIDGFSNILMEDYAAKLDDEGKRLVNIVRDNALRMARLIDDILAFSRLGRKELAQQEVDMSRLASETAADLASSWAGREVKLEIGPLPPAHGDSAMLRQVWVNLLSNAIKFTRNRKVAQIAVSGQIEGGELVYCLRDNGAGFDMQYYNKLFGVFSRLHSVEEFEGTGAGLAIVKRIVSRHGGRVWAEGKVNEGATFWFTLPANGTNEEVEKGVRS
jgi:PAS domain S-box-containing protein